MQSKPGADEPSGLIQIYAGHRAALLRFLLARTGDPSEAEDVVQELWIRLQQGQHGPVSNGRAYLFQMANNLVLDRARARRRRAAREHLWMQQDVNLDGAEVAAPDAQPEDMLLASEERQQLQAALRDLPDAARRALHLHKIEGLSHAEVAARLGITRSGVEKHMAVAMKHLRRLLLG